MQPGPTTTRPALKILAFASTLAAFSVVSTPGSLARAQATPGPAGATVPDPAVTSVEEGPSVRDALAQPSAAPAPVEGYGTPPTLPVASGGDGRTELHVLDFDERRLTLHVAEGDGRDGDAFHCTAPCRLSLLPGRYRLSVQPEGGGPRVADDQPVWIGEGTQIAQLTYDHRSGLRVLGWVFFTVAAASLALSAIGGVFSALVIGAPIATAFLVPFFALSFLTDSARVQVSPLPQ